MHPNILYIHSHDTGRYIEPYGYCIPTPNLKHLAQQGVLFRKAFCGAPTCSPSRACLVTGQSAHNAGMLGLAHRGFKLNDYNQHIAYTLKQAGYETYLAGVQHVAEKDENIGYDQVLTDENLQGKMVSAVVPRVEKFLSQRSQHHNQTPFFLSVGFVETHREFHQTTWQEEEGYTLPPAPLPDTPETRKDMAEFKASARVFDRGVGDVLNALSAAGFAQNTLVICTTDHGIPFPKMKCNLTDHGIGVMLIMRGPGGFEGGKVIDGLVSQIDIFPTICDLLDIDQPSWLQGKSILPLVNYQLSEIHEAIFAEVTFHAAYEPKRAIRTQRFKYIQRFDDRHLPVLPNCDDGYSKDILLAHDWAERDTPQESLYDLILDPTEANKIIDQPEYSGVRADLKTKLNQWMKDTNDPLLSQNPVHPPAGAKINPQDQLSPNEPVEVIE